MKSAPAVILHPEQLIATHQFGSNDYAKHSNGYWYFQADDGLWELSWAFKQGVMEESWLHSKEDLF